MLVIICHFNIYIFNIIAVSDGYAVWTDFVPEAFYNPVAIKFLVSGLLIYMYMLYNACFYSMSEFVFISFEFRTSYHLSV